MLFKLTADAQTSMICDVMPKCGDVAFGDSVTDLGDNFVLKAIVPSVSRNQPVTAQLTPFTTMAARRAMADAGGVSGASVEAANAAVSAIVGVNVLATEPVNLAADTATATAEARQYAAFLAGVGQLAYSSQKGLSGLVSDLAESFEGGTLGADAKVTIGDLTKAVTTVSEELAKSDKLAQEDLTKVRNRVETIEQQTNADGSFTPVAPQAPSSELEKAQGLVAEARTLIDSLASLKDPLDAFEFDLKAAEAVLNLQAESLIDLLGEVVQAVLEEAQQIDLDTAELPIERAITLYDEEENPRGQGKMDLAAGEQGTLFTIDYDLNETTVALRLQTNLDLWAAMEDGTVTFDNVDLTLSGSVENSALRLELTELAVGVELVEAYTASFADEDGAELQGATTAEPEPSVKLASLNGGVEIQAKEEVVSFAGGLQVQFVHLEKAYRHADWDNPLSVKQVKLGGDFSAPTGSFSANLVLDVDNAARFDTLAFLDYEPWIERHTYLDDNPLSERAALVEAKELHWAWWDRWSDRTEMGGTWSDPDQPDSSSYHWREEPGDKLDLRGLALSHFFGEDSVGVTVNSVYSSGGYLQAWFRLPDFESASNYASGTLTISLGLSLSEHPDTTATISVGRSGLDSGNAVLTFVHATKDWTISVDKVAGEKVAGIEISSPNGAKVVLKKGDERYIHGHVEVNGSRVGTIATAATGAVVMRWSNGEIETLY